MSLYKNDSIPDHHEFMRSRSMVTDLLSYEQHISEDLENGLQRDYLHRLLKRIRMVNHNILLLKLGTVVFTWAWLNWLKNDVRERSQSVQLLFQVHCCSIATTMFFFIWLINNVVDKLSCTFMLFANDLKLLAAVKVYSALFVCREILRVKWCNSNENEMKNWIILNAVKRF